MAISIDDIRKLKELTGVGLTDAKVALVAADGNFDKALEEMRKKGLLRLRKKLTAKPSKASLTATYTADALVFSWK